MKKLVLAVVMLFSFMSYAQARVVDDVNLPDTFQAGNSQLVLNGAGVRSKWFLSLYVGGLYLPKKTSDAQAVVDANEPQALVLHVISGMISVSKMQSGTMDDFERVTQGHTAPYKKEIDQFIGFFKAGINDGDIYEIVYLPNQGIEVYRTGAKSKQRNLLGTITSGGMAFKKVLFGIWLSDRPAQEDLKEAMLGKSD